MFKGFRALALMLLLLVVGAGGLQLGSGRALAQDAYDGGAPSQSSDPSPVNPARQVYDNGNLIVIVQADRNYGFRIGSPVPLEIDFIYKPGYGLDLSNLFNGEFDLVNGSDLDLVDYPALQVYPTFQQDGMNITRVKLSVRTWTMKEAVTFNSQFLWAKEKLSDGNPNWQKAMTPDFVITRSFTAVSVSKNLDEGDLALQASPHPTVVRPMRIAGFIIALIPVAWVLLGLGLWAFPPRQVPAHERFWQSFTPLRNRSTAGLSYDDAGAVAGALRTYFKVEPLADPSEIELALQEFYENDSRRYEKARAGKEAFEMLEAMYKRREEGATNALSASETRDLFARIDRLVPRP